MRRYATTTEHGLIAAITDTVIVTCQSCGKKFWIPRWQFEVEVKEEGKYAEFYCSFCSGADEVLGEEDHADGDSDL